MLFPYASVQVVRVITALSLAAALSACGTNTEPATDVDDTGASEDTALDDTGEPDVSEEDSGRGDVGDADSGSTDTQTEDTESDAAEVGADTADDVGGEGAAIGEPCEEDEDCDSEICAQLADAGGLGGLCTTRCTRDDQCLEEFDCVFLTESGEDAERICLPTVYCIDSDGDGFGAGPDCVAPDCDDSRSDVNFGEDEVCDGIDNDCDGEIDDSPVDVGEECTVSEFGACGDGEMVCQAGLPVCEPSRVPEEELCDGEDNDCDSRVDEGFDGSPMRMTCYGGDQDLVGIGVCASGARTCRDGLFSECEGEVLPSGEVCDGLDNDCDGEIDEELAAAFHWPDEDADGFGDGSRTPIEACTVPFGFAANPDDCDDTDRFRNPDAEEIPADGTDSDCDGAEACYPDVDGDGYYDSAATPILREDLVCDGPGIAEPGALPGDCNDSVGAVNPGADETPGDEVDANCDMIELCLVDADNDGYHTYETVESANLDCDNDGEAQSLEPGGDCNDDDPTINPGAEEQCDDIDHNCNDDPRDGGGETVYYPDNDDDGYGDQLSPGVTACFAPTDHVENNLDCNDARNDVNPDAEELVADGIDQNCDTFELCYVDSDGDNQRPDAFATVLSPNLSCTDVGEALSTTPIGDCNDGNPAIYLGATELPADLIDQNCDNRELCYLDLDNDGWRPTADATIESPDMSCNENAEANAFDPVGDCVDDNPLINPAATEICDGIDNNCNGPVDAADPTTPDNDGDSYNICEDCNDSNGSITDTIALTVTGGGAGSAVPSSGTSGSTNVNVFVSSVDTVVDLDVMIDITHTFAADLDIYLYSPSDTRVTLVTDEGSSGDNFSGTVFDDEAGASVVGASAPFNGSYRPEQPLSAFDGQPINGTWRLEIIDDAGSDSGTLHGWELRFRTTCN